MAKQTRHDAILKLLIKQKTLSVNELSDVLKVTPTTIRRDLLVLEEKNQIIRTQGYAHINEEEDFTYDSPIINDIFIGEKKRIAKKAVEMLYLDIAIFLDSGSTLMQLAKEINLRPQLSDINIVTHAYDIAAAISNNRHISMPGGVVHHYSHSVFGIDTAEFYANIQADIAFIGTNGFHDCPGLTVSLPLMLEIKQNMVKSARRIVALADSSKFLSRGTYTFCDFENVDTLITIATPENEEMIDNLRKMGIEIILA